MQNDNDKDETPQKTIVVNDQTTGNEVYKEMFETPASKQKP